jgi:hypothetical protein
MKQAITYFEIAAFIASLAAWPQLKKKKYLSLFPLLLFVVVVVEVQQAFFRKEGSNNSAIYNIQVPLQQLLYLFILYLSFESNRYKRAIRGEMVAYLVFTLITAAFFTEKDRFNILAYCFGSVLIIVGILAKFYELLQNPGDYKFPRNPFFYMLFAFLLFNLGTLPYFTMSNWLHFFKAPQTIVKALINVMSVFNYILYSIYTLSFLWMIRKADSS